ncbi:hypothetical protein V8F06_010382 [Rhypophila decipiens]
MVPDLMCVTCCSRDDCGQSRIRRIINAIANAMGFGMGGVPTLAILNFNQNLGKCPLPDGLFTWKTILHVYKDYINKEAEVLDVLSHGWHLLLRYWNQYLPDILVCPRWPVYLLAMSTYSAVGIYHLVYRQPRYWAESGLPVMLVSIILGSWYGVRAMFNSLILGAFLSLLCCKILDWALQSRANKHRVEVDCALVDSDIYTMEKAAFCQERPVGH